ncbi:MAG: xanthine dehydrogenase family protein molybdopterin-binding subunit [Pseudomonadota bacterium]|nr:xanthine dehydrogenase family protein molybdopterin-binding subunit [Pseudomonadota bacterium]
MGYMGKPLKRREDSRFLRGAGRYVDDITLSGMVWCGFVRSPHAHAEILKIDTARAEAMPGVLKVLTHADWEAADLGELTVVHPMPFGDGRPMNESSRPAFARDRVRHVGDVVAAVVAETRTQVEDALERVNVDYKTLASVTEVARALESAAPVIHPQFGDNTVFEIEKGDRDATERALADAHHVVEMTLPSNRVSGSPMEPRSYLCDFDTATGRYTLYATTQTPHYLKRWLAVYTLFVPEHKIRVVAPDVGGGFGLKVHYSVEVPTIAWAAGLLGRPVKWTATRSECLMSDSQARDHHTVAKMGFSEEGEILALQVDTIAALGGYLSNFAPSIPGNSYPQTLTGLYRTPVAHLRVRGAYTNTVPVDAYRGSGRPEATWVNERLTEQGAHELGIDVADIRRRNLIRRDEFPYPTPAGRTYDCGNPPLLFNRLITLADYNSLRTEQVSLRNKGVLMGIGISCFLDKSGTGNSANLAARGGMHGGYESAVVRVHSDGRVTLFSGSHSHGQGHDITFSQIAADRLGIDINDITLIEGDTDMVPFGNGTWGSRSLTVGGSAVMLAADRVAARGRRIAAHMLECAEEDINYKDATYTVGGTDRHVTFRDVADNAYHGAQLPSNADGTITPGLEETVFWEPKDTNDPQAMHLAVVIVDRDTGTVTLRDYYTSDDCGVVINPMIVEGQVHGGLGQGIGQALMENVVYDHDGGGQLISGTFADYCLPRADDLPSFNLTFIETPAPSNPLGVKGGSESGTIGAPAAIGNAVVDALWHLGVRNVRLPITSQTVWETLKSIDQEEAIP